LNAHKKALFWGGFVGVLKTTLLGALGALVSVFFIGGLNAYEPSQLDLHVSLFEFLMSPYSFNKVPITSLEGRVFERLFMVYDLTLLFSLLFLFKPYQVLFSRFYTKKVVVENEKEVAEDIPNTFMQMRYRMGLFSASILFFWVIHMSASELGLLDKFSDKYFLMLVPYSIIFFFVIASFFGLIYRVNFNVFKGKHISLR
jgi:hypothetical protein